MHAGKFPDLLQGDVQKNFAALANLRGLGDARHPDITHLDITHLDHTSLDITHPNITHSHSLIVIARSIRDWVMPSVHASEKAR
jgi:hypothetical protein